MPHVTLATSGTCTVAASTRYSIVCKGSDNSVTYGTNSTSCSGCLGWLSQTYASAFPATFSGGGSYAQTPAYYMNVVAIP